MLPTYCNRLSQAFTFSLRECSWLPQLAANLCRPSLPFFPVSVYSALPANATAMGALIVQPGTTTDRASVNWSSLDLYPSHLSDDDQPKPPPRDGVLESINRELGNRRNKRTECTTAFFLHT